MSNDDGCILFLLACLLFPVLALIGLWSLNTLFGLGLAYSVKNVFAVIALSILAGR